MTQNSLIIKCTGCGVKNRVPEARLEEGPKCGKCGTRLPEKIVDRPVNVTDATFHQEVMMSELPVLVDCWAPWCGPCRMVAPVLDELAMKYRGRLKIAKVNVDENPGTGSRFSITSVPTLLLVKNGQIIDQVAGALPKDAMESQIARII